MTQNASTTDQARRLPVLVFQLGRALRDLDATARKLDPKLQPLFEEQVEKLRERLDVQMLSPELVSRSSY
jgi:hypothetical protein